MFIYLLTGLNDGILMHKIGISKNVNRRLKQLRTGNPTIALVYSYESINYKGIETSMHRRYKHKKFSGEWFILDKSDVESFIEDCKLIDYNITLINAENTYINNKL